MKKYKKMTQFLVSKKLRHVIFFYLLRNHGVTLVSLLDIEIVKQKNILSDKISCEQFSMILEFLHTLGSPEQLA